MTALASGQDIDSQAIEGQIRLARRDNASNKANTLTVSGSRTRQSEALEAIAAILQYGLDEHAYRKICEIITSADVLGNPTTLVRYLKITFAPLPTKVSAQS